MGLLASPARIGTRLIFQRAFGVRRGASVRRFAATATIHTDNSDKFEPVRWPAIVASADKHPLQTRHPPHAAFTPPLVQAVEPAS